MKKILITFLILLVSLCCLTANASDFAVTDLSLQSGVIDSTPGSIEITFSAPVDADTKDAIKLLTSDGEEIPGGSYVSLSADRTKATLVYGRLAAGEYKLIVTEELLSEDGDSVTPFEADYIVETSIPENKILEVNFDNLNTGNTTAAALAAALPGTSYGTNVNATYSIGEAESGKKYLVIKTKAKNSGASMAATLPQAIERGKVYLDMRLKVTDGTLVRNMFMFSDGNSTSLALRMVQYVNTEQGIRNDSAGIGCNVLKKMPDKDDDGFFSLRLCIERNSTSDKWTAVCYDMNSDDMDIVFESKQPFSNISSIQRIQFAEIYPQSDAEAAEAVYVSDIRVSTQAEPQIIYTEGDFEPDTDTIKVALSEDADTVSADIYSSGGEKFDADIALSEDKRTVFVTPLNYMTHGAEYRIEFSGAIGNAILKAKPYPAEVVSLEASGDTLSYTISTDKPNSSYVLFICGYNEAGEKVGIVRAEAGTDTSLTGNADISPLSEAELFKVYVWEKLSDSYLPLGLPHNVVRNQ